MRAANPTCRDSPRGEALGRVDQEDQGRLDEEREAGEVDLPGGATLPVVALPERAIGISRNG